MAVLFLFFELSLRESSLPFHLAGEGMATHILPEIKINLIVTETKGFHWGFILLFSPISF